jgi:hypothetical protein
LQNILEKGVRELGKPLLCGNREPTCRLGIAKPTVSQLITAVARVATKTFAIPQTTPSQVILSSVLLLLGDFDRRKRIGTNKSMLNQAITM